MTQVTVSTSEMSWDDLVQLGQEIRDRRDKMQFALGDVAIDITRLFGSQKLKEYAKDIKYPYKTILRYRDVSKAYSLQEREQFSYCNWTQFRDFAAKENRIELLTKSADKDWSPEKSEVMASDDPNVIRDVDDVPSKPRLKFCYTSHQWYIPENRTCPPGCEHKESK